MSNAAEETTARIWQHYREMGVNEWGPERFYRLCRMLNCLPEELAALCCVRGDMLRRCLKRQRFPEYIALHFALIENAFVKATTGHSKPMLMPIHLLNHD